MINYMCVDTYIHMCAQIYMIYVCVYIYIYIHTYICNKSIASIMLNEKKKNSKNPHSDQEQEKCINSFPFFSVWYLKS